MLELDRIIEIIIFAIFFGITFYYIKYTKDFIFWIKEGIENGDNKLENKELQIFLFTILGIFMVLTKALLNIDYPDVAYYSVFGAAGILYSANNISKNIKK